MYNYKLVKSNRKTTQIVVLAGGTVEIRAPYSISQKEIEYFVHSRENWITKKIEQQKNRQPFPLKHTYTTGELFRYLGKTYTLWIEISDTKKNIIPAVTIKGSMLVVLIQRQETRERTTTIVKNTVEKWMRTKAKIVFTRILEECWVLFHAHYPDKPRPELKLRKMKTRWGSLSLHRTGFPKMTLNTFLVCTDPACIKQVIFHELCHLIHPDHSRNFYAELSVFIPDWKKTKLLLEKSFEFSPQSV
jgi:predicted metal-dependent hydrolase